MAKTTGGKTRVVVMLLHHPVVDESQNAQANETTCERSHSYLTDEEDLQGIVEEARKNHPWASHFEIRWGKNPIANGPLHESDQRRDS